MQNGKPKYPPSKRRYLKKNPVVSFHLPAEDLKKLREMASRDGVKISDYFRNVARQLTATIDYAKEKEAAYEEGRKAGFEAARKEFEITLPCYYCGEPVTFLPGTPDRERLIGGVAPTAWACENCMKRRGKAH